MPSRQLVAKELADTFKLIAHPDRIRLIEQMRKVECDVNTLAEHLELTSARVSQHLALLRAHRIVEERRDGRRHLYHLTQPEIAQWIVDGLDFIEGRLAPVSPAAIENARQLWSEEPADETG